MHKNTLLTISILTVVAALLLGINIGRRIGIYQSIEPTPGPTAAPTDEPPPFIAPIATPEASDSGMMEQSVYGQSTQSAQFEQFATPSAVQE